MAHKNRQYPNIKKWGNKKKVVENTSQRLEIIGREARKIRGHGRSIGDPFCEVHQSIGADHP